MPRTPAIPYLLLVRWPVGGIRTHLKYARELLPPGTRSSRPILVAYDDEDTRLAAKSLALDPADDRSRGVHSLATMALRAFTVCRELKLKVIHSQGFISSILGAPTALLLNKRHIVTVHDVITDQVIAETSPLSRVALGLALRLSFAVHAVGEDCAASIRRLPFMQRARNILVISNGVDPRRFTDPAPCDLRRTIAVGGESKVIGFFGRFHPQKGFTLLVDALYRLKHTRPDLPLHVLAVGSGGFQREYQDYVRERGLAEHFHFLPQVENPASLMAACDMIAMPSLWEAYGLLAAEVMALGIPLIASDCIGLKEVTEHTPVRRVPSGDCAALAQAIAAEAEASSTESAEEFRDEARRRFDFTESAIKINRLLHLAHSGGSLKDL